jgi:DNA-binding protein HU-beta
MNRSDIVKAVANQCPLSQKDVDQVLDLFVETIKLALECDEDVLITGFGKFAVRERKPVNKVNPKTGEKLEIPAKSTFVFTPSKVLKQQLTKVKEERLEEAQATAEKV